MKNLKKIIIAIGIFVIAIGLFVACGDKSMTVPNGIGGNVKIPKHVERIISTAPSNTEILVGLGLGKKIVAEDQYSAGIKGVNPDVPKINFMHPNAESIIALKPDLVVASATNELGTKNSFKLIEEAGIPVVYIPSTGGFNTIYKSIEYIAKITDTEKKGTEMVDQMKQEVSKVEAIGSKIKDKKSVYFEIGSKPSLYSFGNDTFLNSMLEMVGAKNIFGTQKGWISPSSESVVKDNPDVILTNETYLKDPVKMIENRPGWNTIKAVQDKQVFTINQDESSRPSQFAVKALVQIAKAIYPKEYANLK